MNVITLVFVVYGKQHPLGATIRRIAEQILEGFPGLRYHWSTYTQVLRKRGFTVSIAGDQDWLTSGDTDSPLAVGLAIQRAFALRDQDNIRNGGRPSQVVFVAAGLSEQCLGPDALVVWHGNCYTVRSSTSDLPHVVHEASPE